MLGLKGEAEEDINRGRFSCSLLSTPRRSNITYTLGRQLDNYNSINIFF